MKFPTDAAALSPEAEQRLAQFAQRLIKRRRRAHAPGIVGANVGKNRDATDAAADYATGIRRVCAHADYLVCNVSSPNTPGLRSLQARKEIEELRALVQQAVAEAEKQVKAIFAKWREKKLVGGKG